MTPGVRTHFCRARYCLPLVLALATHAHGATNLDAAPPRSSRPVREIEYSQAAGQSLRLDVSVPDGAGPFPVAVLMHGTEDKSVPYAQSVRFQAELRKNGVECGLATIQRASHKLQAWRSLDREYPSRLLDWLHRTIPNR